VQNGATRSLDGQFTLTFSPPGDQNQSPTTGTLIESVDGVGSQNLVLPTSTYSVRAEYQADNPEDLALLREPQTDSLGVNGQSLIAKAIDLFQQDLAGQLTVSAKIRGDNVIVTPLTTVVKVDVLAQVVEATAVAVDLTFTSGAEFNIDENGKVAFDSSKLGDTAQKIADKMKDSFLSVLGDGVSFVADALSVFTITSNIGTGNVLKAGADGKVTFTFKPCFLKDFSITATPVA
jgi:hypothetical protein